MVFAVHIIQMLTLQETLVRVEEDTHLMFLGSLAAKHATNSLSALLPEAMTQPLKSGFCCSAGSASSNASIRMMTWAAQQQT